MDTPLKISTESTDECLIAFLKLLNKKRDINNKAKAFVVEITDILISSTQCWMNVFCFVKRMTKIEIKNFLNFKF